FYQGSWMLVGFCQLRKEIRSFLIDRIIELDRTWTSFTPIKDFDLEKYFSPSWGIHDADSVDITVRFESKVSEYLLRRDKWHSSEKRIVLPSGDIELSFTVAGIEEIKRWIYSWIPHVEVVKPAWFRKQVNKELGTTVEKHL
ncbi:MAG: helix-turn-helix transcriptional regulator, partial [Candidatus Anammoxibacter sp.]